MAETGTMHQVLEKVDRELGHLNDIAEDQFARDEKGVAASGIWIAINGIRRLLWGGARTND